MVVDPDTWEEVNPEVFTEEIPGTWKVAKEAMAMDQVDLEAFTGVNTDTQRKVEEDM